MTTTVEYVNPPGLAPAQGLYSQLGLIRQGTPCLVAGQLAVGDAGEVVGVNDFAAQFARVFHNLKSTLEAAGGGCHSIAKMTTFLTSADSIPEFMRLRAELFPTLFPDGVYPPNTLLIISRLVKPEFMLEVEAVAAL
ncbi:RidA family protein [Pigmentiphaga sp. H8]|uniref:RidA family protein n=1 Tax=Pigmentiphaga sp. H8 TaxID=2488560 RepID=UPI000F59FF1F|nr:RidA family protein [Pigmentiphaga sp. H8]AZG11158.1 RidA family protein [Pigmentiphaga sp. H8]